jgi:hypothetical protein
MSVLMHKHLLILVSIMVRAVCGGLHAQTLYTGSGAILRISPADTVYVVGNTLLDAGSNVVNNGTLQFNGMLTTKGTMDFSTGTLSFSSTGYQPLRGNALTVGSLVINNSSSSGVGLAVPITVNTSTTFVNGVLNTYAASPLIYAGGASPGTPTDASHVNGPVQFLGTGAFTFPVGSSTSYKPIGVNLSANSAGMTASYTDSSAKVIGTTYAFPLVGVSTNEYWTLTPAGSATGTVTLNWRSNPGIRDTAGVAVVKVAHYTGGTWISEGGTGSGTPDLGFVTSNPISSWSPFALGTTDLVIAPLPVSYTGIAASLEPDGSRLVIWSVAQDIKTASYTVQRSSDGSSFTDAGTVAALGSSDPQTYHFFDADAVNTDVLYYRVRDNDKDGQAGYSKTVLLREPQLATITVTPNPVKDNLQVHFGDNAAGDYSLDIISSSGELVHRRKLTVSARELVSISRPAGIVAGLYVVRLTHSNGSVQYFKLFFE